MNAKSAELVRNRLNKLHDEEGMSWRQIAKLPQFDGILAAGSLCSFANGGYEPKRCDIRDALGLGPSHDIRCPHCSEYIQYNVYDLPCPYCNSYFIDGHDDHIIPRVQGGPDEAWNIVLCCRECNLGKKGKHPWEWFGCEWRPNAIYDKQFQKVVEFLNLSRSAGGDK